MDADVPDADVPDVDVPDVVGPDVVGLVPGEAPPDDEQPESRSATAVEAASARPADRRCEDTMDASSRFRGGVRLGRGHDGPVTHTNLLGPGPTGSGPTPTRLPEEVEPLAALESGAPAAEVAAAHPGSSLAWAVLAETALAEDRWVEAYAYARVGYHRGLDALRRAGWKGAGPVPWAHHPNQGFLRALAALGRAAAAIGEDSEHDRCLQFLRDSDPAAVDALT